MTLGAPLAGAASSIFWQRQEQIADGQGDDMLAARKVVAGIDAHWGLPDFMAARPMAATWERLDTGDRRGCDGQIRHWLTGASQGRGRTFTHMYGAIVHEEQNNDKRDADDEARLSFVHLPPMALGALAQCMEHSVLSGACTSWARAHVDGDKAVQARIGAKLLANARDGDDQACLLLEFSDQANARHASSD